MGNASVHDKESTWEDDTLPGLLRLDCNDLVIRAFSNSKHKKLKGHTRFVLITPADAWTKRLIISGGTTFGYELNCGVDYGVKMDGKNKNNKCNTLDLGVIKDKVAIKFEKAKTFGLMTDFGTIQLGKEITKQGLTIMIFWPNDSTSDHWEHFKHHLGVAADVGTRIERVTKPITNIANDVISVGKGAAELDAMIPKKK